MANKTPGKPAAPKKEITGPDRYIKGFLVLLISAAWLTCAVMYWNMKDPFTRMTDCLYLSWLRQRLDPAYFPAVSVYFHSAPLLLTAYILTVMIPDTIRIRRQRAPSVLYTIFAGLLLGAAVLMAVSVCTYLTDYARGMIRDDILNRVISVSDTVYLWLTPVCIIAAAPFAVIQGIIRTGRKQSGVRSGIVICLVSLLAGVILAACSCMVLAVLWQYMPGAVETVEGFCHTMASSSSMMLIALCLAPLIEETVFRGLIQHHLTRYFGPYVSILLASLAFGIWHRNIGQAVYTFIMGLFTGSIYHVTGRLRYPVLAHFAMNLTAVLAYSDSAACLLGTIPFANNIRLVLISLVTWKAVIGIILAAGLLGVGIGLIDVRGK